MGIVTEEAFTHWFANLPKDREAGYLPSQFVLQSCDHYSKNPSTLYQQIREFVIDGGCLGKRMRPWEVDKNLMRDVDRSESWWGWEFETGWNSAETRSRAVEFTWDNFTGVTFDHEGEGLYPVEITFIPEVQSAFDDGEAQAQKFMRWVDAHQSAANNTYDQFIGTHLNVSIPEFADKAVLAEVLKFTNHMLYWTGAVEGDRQWLFGREQLYGLAYARQAPGTGVWAEFKTFRTAYSYGMFERYCKVAGVITKLMRQFAGLSSGERLAILREKEGISNLRDIVENGAEPIFRPMRELLPLQSDSTRPQYFANGRNY